MDEQNESLVILQDEQGNDVEFEHLMTVEHEGSYYIVLEAVQDMDDCMEGEAVILKIEQDDEGQDIYVTIDDEEELKTVFEKCVAAMEEQEEVDDVE